MVCASQTEVVDCGVRSHMGMRLHRNCEVYDTGLADRVRVGVVLLSAQRHFDLA